MNGLTLLLVLGCIAVDCLAAEVQLIDAPPADGIDWYYWPSQPPAGCPFKPSTELTGLGFTGRHAEYTNADTWYPTWASDGDLYSPFTDGVVNGLQSVSIGENATTGHARIVGDDPLELKVVDEGVWTASALPYGGRYPCGSLVYNGVWYYGTYCLADESVPGYNWGVLGPFVGFRTSNDFGKTWTETLHTPAAPLFPEPAEFRGPVKIGSPHFVDFGRNMQHSPDGKAYLIAHGALIPDPLPHPGNASWITGDAIYLLRVTPSLEIINDPAAYEFFAGYDADGKALWTNDFKAMKPLLEFNNHCGCVTVTYNPGLGKYLMCLTDGGNTVSTYDTCLLEADSVAGPWRMVTWMRQFGTQGYFVNLPSKFLSEDGQTAWLCYAANFTGTTPPSPPGSRYGMCLQEVKLLGPDAPRPSGPLFDEANLARTASVTVSSTFENYSVWGAVDGVVGGFPGATRHEWATDHETKTGTIRLEWDTPQLVDRIWLFDRPNTNADQVTQGFLLFDDGTSIAVGPLPDDATQGIEVSFEPKRVKWLAFAIADTKTGAYATGLSEIAVFAAD